ncbi:MAG: glycosyltransferase family 2 protein [Methanomicrobiales archaeon]|nr:glycosyltransferase family 2 protein [Methanomicrobiales archaeon]
MISVIIPIFNEEEMLTRYDRDLFPVIESLKTEFSEDFEIILVDDGSRDKSWEGISRYAKSRTDTVGLKNERNCGMGCAMKNGIRNCKGDVLVVLDADLTFRPEDIRKLLSEYRKSPADCINGSPYLGVGLLDDVQLWRLILSKSVNIMYRILLRQKVTSISPIFRLYRRSVFDKIQITSNNFEINAEILAKMIIGNMTVHEVPVALHKRELGQSKANTLKSIRNHLRILSKIFMVKYLKREWT